MPKNTVTISLPSLSELKKRTPRVYLKVSESNDGVRPFSKEVIEELGDLVKRTGIYVHLWEKSSTKTVVRYVGQTGDSFKKRLNKEFVLQNKQVSQSFREKIKEHIEKRNLYTVFFDDNDIQKMVMASRRKKRKKEVLRLLVEQAMIFAYNSNDLLNQHKK